MTKYFGWEDLWLFPDVTRRPELVLEPSVLVLQSSASPTVSGSVLFGKFCSGGLEILSPERGACAIKVKYRGKRGAKELLS